MTTDSQVELSDYRALREFLTARRRAANLTQAHVGNAMIPPRAQTYISDLESGVIRNPTWPIVVDWTKALQCTPFIGIREEEQEQ